MLKLDVSIIQDYLEVNNMTQEEFANKCGLDKAEISGVLRGKRRTYDPRISRLFLFAKAMGIPKENIHMLLIDDEDDKIRASERIQKLCGGKENWL